MRSVRRYGSVPPGCPVAAEKRTTVWGFSQSQGSVLEVGLAAAQRQHPIAGLPVTSRSLNHKLMFPVLHQHNEEVPDGDSALAQHQAAPLYTPSTSILPL